MDWKFIPRAVASAAAWVPGRSSAASTASTIACGRLSSSKNASAIRSSGRWS